ncbi:myelin expression factor 2 isoform X2 [Tribolium madens]|uniref:myelin expression factor 2 isoform X2 n=1 Tax=Tribolium madens TaxID=41895 RepID=UPI001CF75445|nr:myelin expression factor 2 isoform X2 [Tribolium madens]
MGDRDSSVEKDRSRERSRRERPSRFSEASRERSLDRGRERGGMKSSNCRVYVSNIPYEYRWQDLKDLFRSQVGDVQFVELFVDDNDKSRGCGIVEFSDSASVKKCLEVMQRFEVKTRKLIIKEDAGNIRDKHGNIIGGSGSKRGRDENRYRDERYDSQQSLSNRSGPDVPENKWGNTYGLSPHFLESLRIETPLCNRVFVANLEYNVDKKKLKEVFRLAGRIVRVDLHTDKDGRSRGFAIIEYDHPVEAVQAISMFHNQVLYDRPMSVRIDRANETLKLPEGLKGIGMGLGTNGEPLRDVARNLPSTTNSSQPSNPGAGLLGAVPNQALQMANALTSVVGGSAFGNLSTNPSVLQAANLAGMSGLLSGSLSNADLSLASNLVSNPLVQNSTPLAALGGSGGSGNLPQSLGSNNSNSQSFSRENNSFGNNQNNSFGQSQSYSSGRNFQNYETKSSTGGGYSFGGGSRDGYGSLSGSLGNLGGTGQLLRNQNSASNIKDGGGFSRKVLVSNLPASASYKMLNEKFNEFGDVQHIEEKGTGTMLIVYSADWQAERAIKNLDRARIDGRTIEARLFY